jgi:hypothetical protein
MGLEGPQGKDSTVSLYATFLPIITYVSAQDHLHRQGLYLKTCIHTLSVTVTVTVTHIHAYIHTYTHTHVNTPRLFTGMACATRCCSLPCLLPRHLRSVSLAAALHLVAILFGRPGVLAPQKPVSVTRICKTALILPQKLAWCFWLRHGALSLFLSYILSHVLSKCAPSQWATTSASSPTHPTSTHAVSCLENLPSSTRTCSR